MKECPFKYKITQKIVWDKEPYSVKLVPLDKPWYACRLICVKEYEHPFECIGEDKCPIIKS